MPQSRKKLSSKPKKKLLLELKNTSKVYHLGSQDIVALRKVNLKVYEGEFLAIMGPSGSGKSTLLQVASMLAHPSSGKVILKGTDVTEYDEIERAHLRNKEIGFVFQQFNLLKKTSAVDNVALPLVYADVPLAKRNQLAKDMLKQVGLEDRFKNTPAQLSGGQQQRVAVARALVNNPAIIFADEPTGNLDSKSGADIEKLLIKLSNSGKTIIMVTHEDEVAKIASRKIVVKDGEIISDVQQKRKKS